MIGTSPNDRLFLMLSGDQTKRSTFAGGRRTVEITLPSPTPLPDLTTALSSAFAVAAGAASTPQLSHRTQFECQRWYVPRRTQSSSTTTAHATHASLGGLGTGTLLSAKSRGASRNGDSPATSGARLRKPYVTP